jgi:hypothetical protein
MTTRSSRVLPLIFAPALALVAAGCARDFEPVSLAEFGPHTVEVEVLNGALWSVRITHSDPANNCAPLSHDVTVTVDHMHLGALQRGGEYIRHLERKCADAIFGGEVEPEPVGPMETRIVIADESARVVVEGHRLREPRTFAPVAPVAPVPPGGTVELTWSHPFDKEVRVETEFPQFRYDPPSMEDFSVTRELQGQTLVLAFPDNAKPGKGNVTAMARAAPSILACEGAVDCRVELSSELEVPLEIGAPAP